jgi:hypothetical protein
MTIGKTRSRVLWYECAGFTLIILLAWLDELTELPSIFFGGAGHMSDWRDSAVLTLLILVVWGVVFLFTRRLLAHLYYLEGFLRVCAWCRKVGHGEKWLPLEKYFEEGFDIETTHGVCPECFRKMQEDTAQFRKQEASASAQPEVPEPMPEPRPSPAG